MLPRHNKQQGPTVAPVAHNHAHGHDDICANTRAQVVHCRTPAPNNPDSARASSQQHRHVHSNEKRSVPEWLCRGPARQRTGTTCTPGPAPAPAPAFGPAPATDTTAQPLLSTLPLSLHSRRRDELRLATKKHTNSAQALRSPGPTAPAFADQIPVASDQL